ncbi:MAG: hypothetical protein J6D03_01145 [Clostridia bacterium]|nr:hypothetical protein [Clostridia bacterium]
MFTLRGRQDKFRFMLPDEFIPKEINEKYTKILISKHSFYTKPIDFVNETIQKIQVLGFNNATVAQTQPGKGEGPLRIPSRIKENEFMYPATDYNYRSPASPKGLLDKTINVTFRHTIGFLNYFILFESFIYQYTRDTEYKDLDYTFNIDLMSNKGSIYSKIVLMDPLVEGMDMLDLDYTQPIASSQTFNMSFKYSNFDYQFINYDATKIGRGDTIYDEDKYYIDPIQPMYEHNRTYTKYDERTGEILGTVNPVVEDLSINNSGMDNIEKGYYETPESSSAQIYTKIHK